MLYDVIVVGKGPAGISASLYTSRAGLKTLIIGQSSPLNKAHQIENYFGFTKGIDGESLLEQGESQAESFGVKIVNDEVLSIESGQSFSVKTANTEYLCKAILIATGNPPKTTNIQGAEKFEGNGIHYCASCDGFFYKSLKVGVLGNKDYAVHIALELLNYTKDITVYTNGSPLEISDSYCEVVKRFKVSNKNIEKFEGKDFLEKLYFKDGSVEKIDGLFVAEGSASSIDFARKLGIISDKSTILTDKNQKTNVEGVYAAGDCTGGVKQISTAVGEGAIAGKKIIEYLNKEE